MKLLLLGDTHGNINHVEAVLQYALNHWEPGDGPYAIMQLGDFGLWEHLPSGAAFLNVLEDWLVGMSEDLETEIVFYWVDGNHENHNILDGGFYELNDQGFRPIRPHIWHVPRGHTWEWDGVKCMGFGGAYSVDVHNRLQREANGGHKCWWPQEMITDEQVESVKGKRVDVLFSHDVPLHVTGLREAFLAQNGRALKNIGRSDENRLQLGCVVKEVQPSTIVHGHYHVRYNGCLEKDPNVKVFGFNCDGTGAESFALTHILSLKEGRL